jgi:hypothetical protein
MVERRTAALPATPLAVARAVRRGLANMKIQAYLTAAAINLKRLAAAAFVLFARWMAHGGVAWAQLPSKTGDCAVRAMHELVVA